MADGSSKFKNSINLEPQSADPSNPAEGDTFCSDGTSRAAGYWQYINGAWSEFGGGKGGINYLAGDNSDAENGIGDWVTYADAAGENAVDGTGGTALGVTLTQNTTDPLRETADFKFSKDAADRQGEGASCAFTIDNADKAQKLTISFDYDASSANYADDDIRIAIYDVTNATLIRVNGEDLKGGKGTHLAQFQTAADSTSYRLIIHQSSTNATAYDVYLDNISVGPREVVKGAAMTDWVEYTPTSNLTTNVTHTAHYRRVGDSIEITGKISFSGSNTDSGGVFINLPSGLQADTSKDNADFETSIGHATFVNTGTASIRGVVTQTNSTAFTLRYFTDTGAQERVDTANTSVNIPFAVASGDYFYYEFSVPIQGWSSNAVTSEDLGGREVVVEGKGSSTATITATTVNVDFTVVEDTTSSWSQTGVNGDDTFTAPESGYYIITGSISANANILSWSVYTYIKPVGGSFTISKQIGAADGFSRVGMSGIEYLAKGEQLTIRTSDTITLNNSSNGHNIQIQKLASPQTILETETVAARYTSNSGQTITGNSDDVVYEIMDFDTHNAYNTSTGEYTVPSGGIYKIDVKWNSSLTDQTYMYTEIFVGVDIRSRTEFTASRAGSISAINSEILQLEKGDVVKIKLGTSTSSVTMRTISYENVFSIARIK